VCNSIFVRKEAHRRAPPGVRKSRQFRLPELNPFLTVGDGLGQGSTCAPAGSGWRSRQSERPVRACGTATYVRTPPCGWRGRQPLHARRVRSHFMQKSPKSRIISPRLASSRLFGGEGRGAANSELDGQYITSHRNTSLLHHIRITFPSLCAAVHCVCRIGMHHITSHLLVVFSSAGMAAPLTLTRNGFTMAL